MSKVKGETSNDPTLPTRGNTPSHSNTRKEEVLVFSRFTFDVSLEEWLGEV